jgi:hypothetical protein
MYSTFPHATWHHKDLIFDFFVVKVSNSSYGTLRVIQLDADFLESLVHFLGVLLKEVVHSFEPLVELREELVRFLKAGFISEFDFFLLFIESFFPFI